MTTKKVPNNQKFFNCEICNYNTSRKSQFDRHLMTAKHKNNEKYNHFELKSSDFSNNVCNFVCECGKMYPYRSSLYNHKKKCIFIKNSEANNKSDLILPVTIKDTNNNEDLKSLVCKLINENNEIKNNIMKENSELRAQVNELIPKVGNNTINNNQKLNINIFLNEQCKDALNMNEFIKSIEISLEQLDYTKKNGLALGLSNAILENMNKLSLYERPMHCTDIKRETLYIKEEDKWTKDENKEKIKNAIKKASGKNYNALQEWKSNNPDFIDNNLKQEDFSNMVSTIGKLSQEIDNRIIKSLCKETYIKTNKL
jgi:hypothetical protein